MREPCVFIWSDATTMRVRRALSDYRTACPENERDFVDEVVRELDRAVLATVNKDFVRAAP